MSELVSPSPTTVKTGQQIEANNELVISYLTLRSLIGVCGVLLPLALLVFTTKGENDKAIESSISEYYYTNTGEIFVFVLSTLAVFLLTYTGYTRGENRWTNLAAGGALGVAFFPTESVYKRTALGIHRVREPKEIVKLFGTIELHFLFAALFLISIAIVSIFYFTKTHDPIAFKTSKERSQKRNRNSVYRLCGWIIMGCVAGIGVYFGLIKFAQINPVGNFPIVFVLETLAVEAFGFAWLTKGHVLWPDDDSYLVNLFR